MDRKPDYRFTIKEKELLNRYFDSTTDSTDATTGVRSLDIENTVTRSPLVGPRRTVNPLVYRWNAKKTKQFPDEQSRSCLGVQNDTAQRTVARSDSEEVDMRTTMPKRLLPYDLLCSQPSTEDVERPGNVYNRNERDSIECVQNVLRQQPRLSPEEQAQLHEFEDLFGMKQNLRFDGTM
eukprot:Selendium_serpulae@DN581_c0_g1_i1.p2